MATKPPTKSSAPPLEDLVHPTEGAQDNRHPSMFRFGLQGGNYLQARPPTPTWRHKVYWFLRRCIDWIHP